MSSTLPEYLLENGAELDACDEEGWTALMTSASFKHFDMMRFLVEKGANIHARANWGYTVLFYAVIKGSLADVRYLVDKWIGRQR